MEKKVIAILRNKTRRPWQRRRVEFAIIWREGRTVDASVQIIANLEARTVEASSQESLERK